MTVPRAIAPLYATRPYGVRALPFDPRHDPSSLFAEAPFDLAFVPGDNRYSWLAAAMRARWIVAFAGDRPATQELAGRSSRFPIPTRPPHGATWSRGLLDGPPPPPLPQRRLAGTAATRRSTCAGAPYAVLHVGASSPLKHWAADALDGARRPAAAARHHAGVVGRPRRGSDWSSPRSTARAPSTYAGALDLAAALAPARLGRVARRAGHRRRAPRRASSTCRPSRCSAQALR